MIRQQVFFQGHVQGVGFRYTVRRIAGGFAVHGFVRNLPNGQVELVCEGEKATLQQFIAEIQAAMHGHIQHTDIHTFEPLGQFNGFEIR